MPDSPRRFPADVDPAAWTIDLARSSQTGVQAAHEAQQRFARQGGVDVDELKPCDAEGRDGTILPNCVKVYLPPPQGRFGIVFRMRVDAGEIRLTYLAFGVRHHPAGSHALSVYQLADRRLHAS